LACCLGPWLKPLAERQAREIRLRRTPTPARLHPMIERSTDEPPASVPQAVAYVRRLLAGFGAPWFLCGGWAADAWLGRQTREHWDVDISVLHHDQRAIFEHFRGWALVGHDPNVPGDTAEPWNGRRLDLPAHIHVPKLGSSLAASPTMRHTAFEFEFLLNEGTDDGRCVLNRDLDVSVPLERCVQRSPWGLPTAAAEVVLFFKAGGNPETLDTRPAHQLFRPRDEQDFLALLPTLTEAQRSWLREAIGKIRADHPWLAHLGS
jgi:hypothetical protein